jgi:hypothetical protein
MADSPGATAPSPAPAAAGATPANGAPAPKIDPKAAEAKPKVKIALPNGKVWEGDEGQAAALISRGTEFVGGMTALERQRAEFEKKQADFEAKRGALKDPKALRALLQEVGLDPRELGKSWVMEEIDESKLTTEQKKIRELEAEKQARETAEAEAKKQAEQAELEADVESHTQELAQTFTAALQEAGIPLSAAPEYFPDMARVYMAAKRHGQQVDPKAVAAFFQKRDLERLQKRIHKMSPEEAVAWLGEVEEEVEQNGVKSTRKRPFLHKVHNHYLQQVRQKKAGGAQAPTMPAAGPSPISEVTPQGFHELPGELQKLFWDALRSKDQDKAQRFRAEAAKHGVKV